MIDGPPLNLKCLLRFLVIAAGVAIALYGAASFFSLNHWSFNKYAAESKDTISTVFIMLIGAALFLYGFWMDSGDN